MYFKEIYDRSNFKICVYVDSHISFSQLHSGFNIKTYHKKIIKQYYKSSDTWAVLIQQSVFVPSP